MASSYQVGDFEVSIVSDGYLRLDGGAIFGLIPRILWEPVIGRNNIDDEYRIPLGLNCMVVRHNNEILLIETGMGNKHDERTRNRIYPGDYGHLLEELEAIGISRNDVTAVANTHLHTDHCGWNTIEENGEIIPTFPNARYFVQSGEYKAAINPNDRTRATYLEENFKPLYESGQLTLVENADTIIPGITFLPTPGHTENHASVLLESKEQSAIYTGDLVHHEVQMERDAWISAFDILPLISLETKRQVAERAITDNALLICVHNTYPGVGRLIQMENGRKKFITELATNDINKDDQS